eukprot:scaffold8700_cov31-Tisochrysis_lutea.AAC.6
MSDLCANFENELGGDDTILLQKPQRAGVAPSIFGHVLVTFQAGQFRGSAICARRLPNPLES